MPDPTTTPLAPSTPAPTASAPAPAIPATHPAVVTQITPINKDHALFGKVLRVIKQDFEYVVAEIKDGLHDIEAKFRLSEVKAAPLPAPPLSAAAVSVAASPAPTA